MKKILFLLSILLLIPKAAFCTEPITTDSYISPDDVTIQRLESNREVLTDAINNFDGGLILKNTISPDSLKDNANVVIFRDEAFNDWVFTGLLPVTAAGLTSNVSAGTGYIGGERVVKDATSHTYNTSKWTFVDLSNKGTYTFSQVEVDAAEPSITTNSIRLARVTTDGSNITVVRDDRAIAISLTTGEDFYFKGFEITMDSAFDTVTVDSGFLRHGTSDIVLKTAVTGLVLDTAADWHNGTQETYGSAGWAYIGIREIGSIKWLGTNAPNVSDVSGNTAGTLRYWFDGTNYWRVFFAVRVNTDDNINDDLIQQGNRVMWNNPVEITTTISDGAWSGAVSCAAGIPEISKVGIFGLVADDNSANGTAYTAIRPNGSGWPSPATDRENAVQVSNLTSGSVTGQRECFTDSSQQIQHFEENASDSVVIDVEGFVINTYN